MPDRVIAKKDLSFLSGGRDDDPVKEIKEPNVKKDGKRVELNWLSC